MFFFLSNLELAGVFFFFFNDTATTEIYTLSLHDALPIFPGETALCAIGPWVIHVEDAAIKRRPFHLPDVLPQESGVRLVPPELDQLLFYLPVLRPVSRSTDQCDRPA